MSKLITNKNPIKRFSKKMQLLMLACSSSLLLGGCGSTTGTGAVGVKRSQLLLVSQQQALNVANKSYQQLIKQAQAKNVLDKDPALLNRLQGIANRLIKQASVYRTDADKWQWQWQVHTIKSNKANAFVLANGKIIFFSGIVNELKLTDAEIAAVMGHEMAHALREHMRESMSNSQLTQLGLGLAASELNLSKNQAQIAGIVSEVGISMPHSRVQEKEADVMGLELMARAGYNPQAAISVWQKMQQQGKGGMPQFLSTHPSSSNRITLLQSHMPQVTPLYQQSSAVK